MTTSRCSCQPSTISFTPDNLILKMTLYSETAKTDVRLSSHDTQPLSENVETRQEWRRVTGQLPQFHVYNSYIFTWNTGHGQAVNYCYCIGVATIDPGYKSYIGHHRPDRTLKTRPPWLCCLKRNLCCSSRGCRPVGAAAVRSCAIVVFLWWGLLFLTTVVFFWAPLSR